MSLPTVHTTVGLLYDTVVISSALYGAGLLQAWLYYRKYSGRDNLWVKIAVAVVLISDTVQMILLSQSVYAYLVTHHGDDTALFKVEKTLLIELYFSGIIALVTQSFYAWRIFALSKSWILPGLVMLISLASFGESHTPCYAHVLTVISRYVRYTSIIVQFESIVELVTPLPSNLAMTLDITTVVCDVGITLIMIYFLEHSKTGFRRSTDMLNRMIIFVFNTGMPTTICAILALSFLKAEPNTFLYIMFYLLLGRFYTNSLLVTLNSRDYIRNGSSSGGAELSRTGNEISLQTVHGPNGTQHAATNVSIRIETDRIVEDESYSKRSDHSDYAKAHIV
ncbi:hypothetical protein CYLTODRAFT_492646 [Cylindrobasidium torrendii FP15055 ss-10]|uniref:DUF6534 domain-containing protein n=1 Tax=Cylindrobasidium torrendii FP15055 ss-10 TaxID=1314674 RepID=A0A0D7B497_9AGAR|nr:hypothetical protein CYLTODRAFT_492646 [Cylindrobasidium torrendii FP15055 ss-10]